MQVLDDRLDVQHAPESPAGDKLEPEEQAARRVLTVAAPVTLGRGPAAGKRVGTLAHGAQVTEETTTREAAAALGTRCCFCANFDRRAWQALWKSWSEPGNTEGNVTLQRVCAALLDTENAKLPDVQKLLTNGEQALDLNHALAALGVCQALTAILGEPMIVTPESACPADEKGPKGEDLSKCFEPHRARSADSNKERTALYDQIMRLAQGRGTR